MAHANINLKAYKAAIHKTAKVGNNRTTTHTGSHRINRLHGAPVMVVDYTQKRATVDYCGYLTSTTVDAIKGFLEAETGLVWGVSRGGACLTVWGGTLPAPIKTTDGNSALTFDLPA